VAFKAEELTIQIMSAGEGVWACPETTVPPKDKPCQGNSHPPCPQSTAHPGGPACPQDTAPHPKPPRSTRERDAATLALLQAQLRDQLARKPAAAGL
jgi:hypothetical protein